MMNKQDKHSILHSLVLATPLFLGMFGIVWAQNIIFAIGWVAIIGAFGMFALRNETDDEQFKKSIVTLKKKLKERGKLATNIVFGIMIIEFCAFAAWEWYFTAFMFIWSHLVFYKTFLYDE